MWIHYIGEIAIGFFVVLLLAHFGLHFLFKWQKHRRDKRQQETHSLEKNNNNKAAKNDHNPKGQAWLN